MRSAAAPTPALAVLLRAGVTHEVLAYTVEGLHPGQGYGGAVAQALGVDPARMFKTLIVQDTTGRTGTVVLPVDEHLDLKAAARALGWKRAALASPELARQRTGSAVGGISPLGHRHPGPVVVDRSVDDLAELGETLVVSAGQRGLSVRLAPADLVTLAEATVASLSAPR